MTDDRDEILEEARERAFRLISAAWGGKPTYTQELERDVVNLLSAVPDSPEAQRAATRIVAAVDALVRVADVTIRYVEFEYDVPRAELLAAVDEAFRASD